MTSNKRDKVEVKVSYQVKGL